MQDLIPEDLWNKVVSRLNTMGFIINIGIPAVLLVAGYIAGASFRENFRLNDESLTTIKWVLIAVSVGEVAAAFIIKRQVFGNLRTYMQRYPDAKSRISMVIKIMIVIHALSAMPALYGLLYYLLGGHIDGFLLMIILNLIGYQICRPRKSDYDNLLKLLFEP